MITYIGLLLGYIIGLKIWDFYYDKVIVPKLRKEEYKKHILRLGMCKMIGNPNQEII